MRLLNALLIFGYGCDSGIVLYALSLGLDHCYLIVILAVECNVRPSSTTCFISPILHHMMCPLSQRGACSTPWFEWHRLELVFCCAIFNTCCSKGLHQEFLKFIAMSLVVPFKNGLL
jgi:hypothetical protein